MVSVDSLTFDLAGCSLRERSDNHRGWMNADHVAHMLRFNRGPIDWPFDLTDPAAATEFYRNQCADNGGVMLAMGVVTAAGAKGLSGLFKYRSPLPGSVDYEILTFSPDGKRLAVGSYTSLWVLETTKGTVIKKYELPGSPIMGVTALPKPARLLITKSNSVHSIDLDSGKQQRLFPR